MMTYKFKLPMKPFSVNAMSYRDVRFKTKEFKEWASSVLNELQEHKQLVDMGLEAKSSKGITFDVRMTTVYPEHVFFNKAGEVSAKTFDLSNCEKPLIDIIFREWMQIDDRFICHLVSSKEPGSHHYIDITITLETESEHSE